MKITIALSREALDAINTPTSQGGGWQDFIIRLQRNIINGNELTLDIEDIEKLVRYSSSYGRGGWENRLLPLVDELTVKVNNLSNILEGH